MESEDPKLLDLDIVVDTSTESSQNHSLCLVGKLHTNKSIKSFAIMDVMKEAWRAKKGLDAREWTNNLFLFKYEHSIGWLKISRGTSKAISSLYDN